MGTSSKAILAMAILLSASMFAFLAIDENESDAYSKGTSSSPLTSINFSFCSLESSDLGPYYVAVGSSVSISGDYETDDVECAMSVQFNSVTSGFGLTRSNGSSDPLFGGYLGKITGTISKAGTISISAKANVDNVGGVLEGSQTITLIAVSTSTPVTSISFSGSTSVTVGSTVTVTATTSPSSADDRHVTWSIKSGSSYGTIQSTSDTSTGGKCVVKGTSAGTIVLKATAADGSGVSKTVSITVNPASTTYTLTYNANGGSGAPSQQSATSTASSYSFTVSYTEPTRSGYTFLGWSTSSSATSPTYYGGDTITSYGSRILYAVWEQNTTTYYAYLKYNANGGSGAPGQQSASITAVSASGSKSFTISFTEPTRTGYEFLGWSTSSSATSASYQPGGTISVSYGSTTTLYAVWKQITITISGTPDQYGVVGTSWRFTPTLNVSGCTLTVSGADWLVPSGGSVSGTPSSTGTYNITLTATKSGYAQGSMTFSVTVLSALDFQSSPSGGAIIYAL